MKIKLIVLIIAGIVSVSFLPQDNATVGKVSFPLGNVLVLSKGDTQFRQVTFNMPIKNGDKIETRKKSRCELTYSDGSIVRIDEQSIYTVEKAVIKKESKQVESNLSIGKIWANIKKLVSGSDTWRLKSPAAVVAVRGTIYRMNAGADSSSQVLVYDGNVAVSPALKGMGQGSGMGAVPGQPQQVQGPVPIQGPTQVPLKKWFEIIKAQQQIVIGPDGSYAKSDFNLQDDEKLEWVQWNKERDKLIE